MHKIIVGVCIVKDERMLMVKEAKKSCYGLWNFPAGHLDENESIMAGAIRETKEETGYDVELLGLLPIHNYAKQDDRLIKISFLARIIGGEEYYDKNEILDVQWIPIEDLEKMTNEELRGAELAKDIISDVKENRVYPLEVIKDMV